MHACVSCVICACNLIRLHSAHCLLSSSEWSSVAPSDEEEEEEGESTALDLPGHPQPMTALETLQRYLLRVSDSDDAHMNLLSVEQFVMSKGRCTTQMTMDYFLKTQ